MAQLQPWDVLGSPEEYLEEVRRREGGGEVGENDEQEGNKEEVSDMVDLPESAQRLINEVPEAEGPLRKAAQHIGKERYVLLMTQGLSFRWFACFGPYIGITRRRQGGKEEEGRKGKRKKKRKEREKFQVTKELTRALPIPQEPNTRKAGRDTEAPRARGEAGGASCKEEAS